MPRRKTTRAEVEEEILRAREHGSPENVMRRGEAPGLVEDNYPKLDDADLAGVDLSGLELKDAGLKRADLRGAILENINLSGASLDDADLTGTARTRGADFTRALMHRARLGGADLSRAVLRPAYPDFLRNATYNDATRWPEGFDPREYGALKAEPAEPS